MDNIELIKFWTESSDRDYESMMKNYEAKQYTWSLFIGHLVLEKLLKAIYAKVNSDNPYSPKIHNLNIIAKKCGLELDEHQVKILFTCNSFNINARYEDYKNEFYKKCTDEYTINQIKNIQEMRELFKNILKTNEPEIENDKETMIETEEK
ncbi:MAG: HEPN domain-containing protein [Clostridia bacterium]|nr:HEPN domain-containing protein [Clostridia bacterium]